MQINQTGLDLIKRFEGLRLEAYQDAVGIWTIGYGHTETARPGMVITEAEAEALLRQDLDRFEAGVSSLVKVPINENEFSALVSLSFNIGTAALARSTTLKRLNRDDRAGAAEAMLWWNKVRQGDAFVELRGLTRRRAAEKALFLDPVADAVAPVTADTPEDPAESTRVTPIEEPDRRSNLSASRTMQGAGATGAAGAATAATAIADAAKDVDMKNPFLQRAVGWIQTHQTEILIGVAVVLVLAALYIAYARWDDWRKGKR